MEERELKSDEFGMGPLGGTPEDPDALVVQIPVKAFAEMGPEGVDAFYGKIKRIEMEGIAMIKRRLKIKQQNALKLARMGPDGRPLVVA